MPIRQVWTSNLKEVVSKGSLIFHMTASITSTVSILAPSSHEHQPEDDYCLPEEVQSRRDETNTGTYQDLSLDTMDYTSMYSKIKDSCRCMLLFIPLLLNHLVSMLNCNESTVIFRSVCHKHNNYIAT